MEPNIASAKDVFRARYSDGDLTFEQFLELSSCDCFYCGAKPSNKHNRYKMVLNGKETKRSKYAQDNGDFIYNGLDRVDNSLPHNLNNLVPCCKICNEMKSVRSIDDFAKQIVKLYEWAMKQLCTNKMENA